MLGISVYFQDLDYTYLEEAAKRGATYVFTSLHIPEEDYSTLPEKLPVFLETCKTLGLQVVPDVSPVTFEKLGIEKNDYVKLKELGFQSLRLDYGFDDFDTLQVLLKDFDLMLNASVVDREYLNNAQQAGIDLTRITLTHNFYPHTQTGLQEVYFAQRNAAFLDFNMSIQAFVCGDDLHRYPIYEGLPTLEKHRQVHPYVAAVELMHDFGIKDIMIGDSKAKIETLAYIQAYMTNKTMHIKACFEPGYESFYEEEYHVRKDLAENVVRITTPRIPDVPVYHNVYRRAGSITMDNRLFGRYGGEVQLLKKDFDMDARVNVIGFIHPDYVELLQYIDSDTIIKFVKL